MSLSSEHGISFGGYDTNKINKFTTNEEESFCKRVLRPAAFRSC